MKNGFFITGTDTEIGKTRFSVQLVSALRARGEPVAVMKPVASGASEIDGMLRNDDALALLAAAGNEQAYATCNPFCFEPPIAPHVAAREAGVRIDLSRIAALAQELARAADWLVVEGVGGWRVPLDGTQDVASLARRLGLPVVLVVGLRLGCINHALLTAEAIRRDGVPFLGWVANHIDPAARNVQDMIDTLCQRIDVPLLAELSWGGRGFDCTPFISEAARMPSS